MRVGDVENVQKALDVAVLADLSVKGVEDPRRLHLGKGPRDVAVELDLDGVPAGIARRLAAETGRDAADPRFRCPAAHQDGDAFARHQPALPSSRAGRTCPSARRPTRLISQRSAGPREVRLPLVLANEEEPLLERVHGAEVELVDGVVTTPHHAHGEFLVERRPVRPWQLRLRQRELEGPPQREARRVDVQEARALGARDCRHRRRGRR